MNDWDLTFKYEHNNVLHDPLLDAYGNIFYIDSIKGKKVRCFSSWQGKMVEQRGGIPVFEES